MGIAVIVGMLVATVGSSVAESVMSGAGKMDEAKYLNWACKAGMGCTALGIFAKLVKTLGTLG
jgi:hypothetical protein